MPVPSKRLRAFDAAATGCFLGFLLVVATGWFRPESVAAVSGAYALLAVALGGSSATYAYSEGRRPSAGGGEWGEYEGPAEDEPS